MFIRVNTECAHRLRPPGAPWWRCDEYAAQIRGNDHLDSIDALERFNGKVLDDFHHETVQPRSDALMLDRRKSGRESRVIYEIDGRLKGPGWISRCVSVSEQLEVFDRPTLNHGIEELPHARQALGRRYLRLEREPHVVANH